MYFLYKKETLKQKVCQELLQLHQGNKLIKRLEKVWKQEDNTPIVHYLAVSNRINAKLSEDPDTIDFIDLFLDDGIFNLLTTQTNLYSA